MSIATLTSQNQITIPSQIRRVLGLKPGDKIKFYPSTDQSIRILKVKNLEKLQGIFRAYNHGQEYNPHAVWLSRFKPA